MQNHSLIRKFFFQITIPPAAYDIESLNKELERINIEEQHFRETNYPFTIKPQFSTLGSLIEISRQEPLISFLPDGSIQNLVGFNESTIYEEKLLSPNPVVLLSFDNVFLATDSAQGMIL